ncbi:MAG: glycosyltransferase family 39 protein [Planctomycetaceae bacterium]|nr:glycosyltransferase family 39 protein [Planctomycetaceae bacterium]
MSTRSLHHYFEVACLVLLLAIGFWLRSAAPERLVVEHFDEAVYSSMLWYNPEVGADYPYRNFYAPPLLPDMIYLGDLISGGSPLAPFWFSIVTGTLTIAVGWWFARSFFGRAAGLFVATIIAMSDYHIVYSRMALTDVPVMFFILLSVGLGLTGIDRRSGKWMIAAGIVCGLAWWTKYTGWLPLAIVNAGAMVWWLWKGRREIELRRLILLLGEMIVPAVVVSLPWWIALKQDGGLGQISGNQAGYLSGFGVWRSHLGVQLASLEWLDGPASHYSLLTGTLAAGMYRWWLARGSTWNEDLLPLCRFAGAGIAMALLARVIWTPLMLMCVSLGGFSGTILWPVLERAWNRRQTGDLSPTSPDSRALRDGDLLAAPTRNTALGFCTVCVWFAALLTVTPLYHPYPRLMMPLVAAIWLAAGAGVSWWMESNLSVARRIHRPQRTLISQGAAFLMSSALTGAVLFVYFQVPPTPPSPIYESHRSIRTAALQIATACVRASRGDDVGKPELLPSGSIVRPDMLSFGSSAGELAGALAEWEGLGFDPQKDEIVVYAVGEPALLMHLQKLGLHVAPVATADVSRSRVPTFLVIGPHASNQPSFLYDWVEQQNRFGWVKRVDYFPGSVVLLNLCPPAKFGDQFYQPFEVYQLEQ